MPIATWVQALRVPCGSIPSPHLLVDALKGCLTQAPSAEKRIWRFNDVEDAWTPLFPRIRDDSTLSAKNAATPLNCVYWRLELKGRCVRPQITSCPKVLLSTFPPGTVHKMKVKLQNSSATAWPVSVSPCEKHISVRLTPVAGSTRIPGTTTHDQWFQWLPAEKRRSGSFAPSSNQTVASSSNRHTIMGNFLLVDEAEFKEIAQQKEKVSCSTLNRVDF